MLLVCVRFCRSICVWCRSAPLTPLGRAGREPTQREHQRAHMHSLTGCDIQVHNVEIQILLTLLPLLFLSLMSPSPSCIHHSFTLLPLYAFNSLEHLLPFARSHAPYPSPSPPFLSLPPPLVVMLACFLPFAFASSIASRLSRPLLPYQHVDTRLHIATRGGWTLRSTHKEAPPNAPGLRSFTLKGTDAQITLREVEIHRV
jgi:hypothetical protein